ASSAGVFASGGTVSTASSARSFMESLSLSSVAAVRVNTGSCTILLDTFWLHAYGSCTGKILHADDCRKLFPTHEENAMSKQAFHQLVANVATQIAGRPLDDELDRWLNTH